MAAEETNPREEVTNVTNPSRRVAGVNPVISAIQSSVTKSHGNWLVVACHKKPKTEIFETNICKGLSGGAS
jgi:hypothetical protein